MTWSVALVLWYVVLVALLWQCRSAKSPLAGLSLCYWLNLASHHLVSETLCLFYENSSMCRPYATRGFELSGYAMIGLLLSVFVSRLMVPSKPVAAPTEDMSTNKFGPPQLAVVVGIVVFLFGSLITTEWIPGMSAAVFSANMLVAAGTALWWWQLKRTKALRAPYVLIGSGIFPLLTLVFMGFTSYGIFTLMAIIAFVISRTRVQPIVVFLAVPALYFMLSIGMTYMVGKDAIRASVWGGDTLAERTVVVGDRLGNGFDWFNPYDDGQRLIVDMRFNQNYFVGVAQYRINSHQIRHYNGETIVDGLWALIPRLFWPSKPAVSGGSDLMRAFTGLTFSEGNSFGVGHILEMYANFGPMGMIVGLTVFGAIIGFFDRMAGRSIIEMNFCRFVMWYLPGTTLLTGSVGRFAEVPPGLIGGFGLAYVFHLISQRIFPPLHRSGVK